MAVSIGNSNLIEGLEISLHSTLLKLSMCFSGKSSPSFVHQFT
jgi:hypothetical protein